MQRKIIQSTVNHIGGVQYEFTSGFGRECTDRAHQTWPHNVHSVCQNRFLLQLCLLLQRRRLLLYHNHKPSWSCQEPMSSLPHQLSLWRPISKPSTPASRDLLISPELTPNNKKVAKHDTYVPKLSYKCSILWLCVKIFEECSYWCTMLDMSTQQNHFFRWTSCFDLSPTFLCWYAAQAVSKF